MWVSDLVPGKMKAEFESILKIHEDGLTAEKFTEEYEKLYDNELAPQQFGCQSVVEMCLWLPDIFEVTIFFQRYLKIFILSKCHRFIGMVRRGCSKEGRMKF